MNFDQKMPRTSAAISEDLKLLLDGAVRTDLFTSKSSAVEQMVDRKFEENEGLRFAAIVGIHRLMQANEIEEEIPETDLIRMADLSDQDLQRALAIELETEPDTDSFLAEIKRSVSDQFDETE